MHYDTLQIARFRGIQSLALEGLSRVNLLVGANNTGKTAVLEALQMLCHPGEIDRDDWLPQHRGANAAVSQPQETWGWLWYERNVEPPIELQALKGGLIGGKAARRVLISVKDQPAGFRNQQYLQQTAPWRIEFEIQDENGQVSRAEITLATNGERSSQINPQTIVPLGVLTTQRTTDMKRLAKWWSALDDANRQEEIIALLGKADPRFGKVQVKAIQDTFFLQADVGLKRFIPVAFLGDGIQRLLLLAIRMAEAKGGVLLIDEIETGFHRLLLPTVWKFIADSAKRFDVQVFATTHSWEAIESAREVFELQLDELALYRLERGKDKIEAVRIVSDHLARMVEAGWEVR